MSGAGFAAGLDPDGDLEWSTPPIAVDGRRINLCALGAPPQKRGPGGQPSMRLLRGHAIKSAVAVKHIVRPHEYQCFDQRRVEATKIILPFDPLKLALGGRSFFVNERNFANLMQALASGNPDDDHHNAQVFQALDEAPGFEPFVICEWSKTIKSLDCSAAIEALGRQTSDVNREVADFVTTLIAPALRGAELGAKRDKCAEMLLSNILSGQHEVLGLVLGLPVAEIDYLFPFLRMFLYYKSVARRKMEKAHSLITDILRVSIAGASAKDIANRENISRRISEHILSHYEEISYLETRFDRAVSEYRDRADGSGLAEFIRNIVSSLRVIGGAIGRIDHLAQVWAGRQSIIDVNSRSRTGALAATLTTLDFDAGAGLNLGVFGDADRGGLWGGPLTATSVA